MAETECLSCSNEIGRHAVCFGCYQELEQKYDELKNKYEELKEKLDVIKEVL